MDGDAERGARVIFPETTERFLREILTRVSPERIAEVRLFTAIRHGGGETGVAVIAAEQEPADASSSADRLVIYTAHYRLLLKGVDRGKWEFGLTADADAPLVTVDSVVQGVLRRSGDAGEPDRFTGAALRDALRIVPVG